MKQKKEKKENDIKSSERLKGRIDVEKQYARKCRWEEGKEGSRWKNRRETNSEGRNKEIKKSEEEENYETDSHRPMSLCYLKMCQWDRQTGRRWEEKERRTSVGLVVNKKPLQMMTIMNHLHTVSQLSPSSLSLLQPLSRFVPSSLFFLALLFTLHICIKS